MYGDPNRTTFELQPNSDTAIWLLSTSSANVWRTVGGRLTDAQRTPGRRVRPLPARACFAPPDTPGAPGFACDCRGGY